MPWQDAALVAAGCIGILVAIVHGILVQRLMVAPLRQVMPTAQMSRTVRKLVPALLHFSTAFWFFGGLALIAVVLWLDRSAKLATGVLVGGAYMFGAVGNIWATRARHAGGFLYALSVVLIVVGLV